MHAIYLLRLLLPFILLLSTFCFGQSTYGLLLPQDPNNGPECKACKNAFKQKPKEIRFAIVSDQQNNLFFEVTNKEWLNTLFKDDNDGFLVDIISKEQY